MTLHVYSVSGSETVRKAGAWWPPGKRLHANQLSSGGFTFDFPFKANPKGALKQFIRNPGTHTHTHCLSTNLKQTNPLPLSSTFKLAESADTSKLPTLIGVARLRACALPTKGRVQECPLSPKAAMAKTQMSSGVPVFDVSVYQGPTLQCVCFGDQT